MANESAAYFRRLVRTGLTVLVGLSLCGAATAQKQLVTSGSVIPLPHPTNYGQIYHIDIAPNGDALFLDVSTGSGALYQLKNGSTTFQTITTSISPSSDTYWNEGLAMDAKGTIYLAARYGTPFMYRVPYNSADGTWDFNASGDAWETNNGGFASGGTQDVFFLDNPAKDGSGLLFVSQQTANLEVIPVNADGTVPLFSGGPDAGTPQFQYIIKGLKDKIMPLQVDVNGNIYFIENPYDPPASRVTGVFFIPASAYKSCLAASVAGTGDPNVPCISGTESSLTRLDPGNPEKYNGMALDAAGNLYVSDASDGYGGTTNALLMVANGSGNPVGVTAAAFNFNTAQMIAPVNGSANPTIDPRGFIWITTNSTNNWSPNGSGPIPGTANFVLWQPGAETLPATLEGTPSTPGQTFFMFSGSSAVTPAAIAFSQPGGGTEFTASTTNPDPPTNGGTSALPCTAGTSYTPNSYCQVWPVFTPSGTNSVGAVEGQVSLLDSSNKIISGATANLTGVGEGPAVALLIPSEQTPLATGLVTPQQVAGDTLGNSYVADSGQGKVLEFAAGATAPSAGTAIGTGLTAPTGVAVDGFGDVYIGDSGKVIEVQAVSGKLTTTQTTLMSGLGSKLNLAVDGTGTVYVADTTNGRVIRLYNPTLSMFIEGTHTVGTFTKPTAVAVDDTGNLFVADGSSLVEVNFWGLQSTITSNLSAPVTGLAVDPSGSVYVAQTGGIIRIPLEAAGLSYNDAAGIDSGGVTAPNGVALDSIGNVYTTAASYTTTTYTTTAAPTSTTVNAPSLLSLTGTFVSFGIVSTQTQSNPVDVSVYDIGNEPLALTGPPTFGGTAPAGDFGILADGQTPCDTSGPGAATIPVGTACTLGVTVTSTNNGLEQGTMAVLTNAVNMPSAPGVLASYAENNLCQTTTVISLTNTNLVYPGSLTVNATTAPKDPTCSAGNTPNGGKIVLTLSPQSKGSAVQTQTVTLVNGAATFSLSKLNGGTYILYVSYRGDTIFGGSSSSRTFTIVVGQATPTVTLSNPAGVTAVNGTLYVLQGSTTTLQATVTSKVGNPTGSVQFLNGTAVADPAQNPVTLSGNGTATFNTSALAAGTYNLTAVYSGDINFASVKSSVVTIVVIPPSVLITASPAAVTTKAGTPVTSTLTITALEGYSPQQGVQLYCETTPVDTVPKYAECTFDVPTVDIFDHPGVPQISHVTLSSNIPTNESMVIQGNSPIAFAGMFGLGLLGLVLRRKGKFLRSRLTVACVVLLLAAGMLGLNGCTNSGYTHTPPAPHVTTPAGTYNITIYALDLSSGKITSLPFAWTVTIQ